MATRMACSVTRTASSTVSATAGGESPGAIQDDPDRDAEVGVDRGVDQCTVEQLQMLGTDLLDANVAVADAEVRGAVQGG